MHPSQEAAIVAAVEGLWTSLATAVNARDFSEATWFAVLAPAFRLDTDDLRRWGITKGWPREMMVKGLSEAASEFPDWEFKVLQMDTSVDPEGQAAVVVANTHSTLLGFQRRSVMTLECALLDGGWRARRLEAMSGFDMGSMERERAGNGL